MLKLTPLLGLLCAGCQTTVMTPPVECSQFIPDSWKQPVAAAPLPSGRDLPAWVTFGIEQSGQLEKSNGRTADILHIVQQCEKNANRARPQKKLLGVL